MWPFGKRSTHICRVKGITFLSEQDGEPERAFKSRISPALRSASVGRAYLVNVTYPASDGHSVALCLAGKPDNDLLQYIGAEFHHMFNRDIHLDIIYLSHQQESSVAQVCRPFHVLPDGSSST